MNEKQVREFAKQYIEKELSKPIIRKALYATPKSEQGDIMETNYKSMGQFFVDVIKADQSGGFITDALKESQEKATGYMEEGDLALGGYLVPEQFQATLLQTSLELAIVKPRATVFPMATNRLAIPAVLDDDHSTDYFGGIVISRTG